MVKFGRRLVEERYPRWRRFFGIGVKNALYAEREDVEGGEKSGLFLKTLETELQKCAFFLVPQSVARSRRNNRDSDFYSDDDSRKTRRHLSLSLFLFLSLSLSRRRRSGRPRRGLPTSFSSREQANDFYVKTETRLREELDVLEEEIKHEKTGVARFKLAKKQIVKHFAPELGSYDRLLF